MQVELAKLKPNPFRDFTVDPIDDEAVKRLTESIKEDGFWGGIVCRHAKDGSIQIGAGHHRVRAAIRAGIETADVCVRNGDMDDAAMIRVYARENATQRGNDGTAQAGSVASAVRFIAKAVLTGMCQEFLTHKQLSHVQSSIGSEDGMGERVVVRFLSRIPGINDGTVRQALANLKSSGNYARIIAEVHAEIERENKEALRALEAAEREQKDAEERAVKAEAARKEAAAKAKAAKEDADRKRTELDRQRAEAEAKLAEKRRAEAEEEMKKFEAARKVSDKAVDTAAKATQAAAKKTKTFDFEGVAKHLKNSHQIDVFRECVTGEGVAPFLPVDRQEELARHLVELYEKRKEAHPRTEFSGTFIRENIVTLIISAKTASQQYTREEKERLQRNDMAMKAKDAMANFTLACRRMQAEGKKIKDLVAGWPKDMRFPVTAEFRDALMTAKKTIDALHERI